MCEQMAYVDWPPNKKLKQGKRNITSVPSQATMTVAGYEKPGFNGTSPHHHSTRDPSRIHSPDMPILQLGGAQNLLARLWVSRHSGLMKQDFISRHKVLDKRSECVAISSYLNRLQHPRVRQLWKRITCTYTTRTKRNPAGMQGLIYTVRLAEFSPNSQQWPKIGCSFLRRDLVIFLFSGNDYPATDSDWNIHFHIPLHTDLAELLKLQLGLER